MSRLSLASAYAVLIAALPALPIPTAAQQVADTLFHFSNPAPAFRSEAGPRVCLDVAHHDFASADRNPGAYRPLLSLLHDDGFRVREFATPFTAAALESCDLLVIADATTEASTKSWTLPNPSAFTNDEIAALDRWVRTGGGLLVIADHNPGPGSAADLGQRLGVIVLDGIAHLPGALDVEVFARSRDELIDHPIVRGRNVRERVDSVATFTGHAFLASTEWRPILRFGVGSVGLLPFPDLPRPDWPHFAIDGWLEAAARQLDRGRVVWLAEVSVCTALGHATGMNNPRAAENGQFCLNIHRWLAGVLSD